MIFLYITIAAFALVIAVDEVSVRIANRRARLHGALGGQSVAADCNPPAVGTFERGRSVGSAGSARLHVVSDAYDGMGAEFERQSFDWPQNVRPIHHRRSLAHPYLRPVNDETPAA